MLMVDFCSISTKFQPEWTTPGPFQTIFGFVEICWFHIRTYFLTNIWVSRRLTHIWISRPLTQMTPTSLRRLPSVLQAAFFCKNQAFLDFPSQDPPFVAFADELSGPNWGPLPSHPGMKYFARRP